MGLINTHPTKRGVRVQFSKRSNTPMDLPVVCPGCNLGIWARGLAPHLHAPSDKGGHGYELAKANLYAARAIQQVKAIMAKEV